MTRYSNDVTKMGSNFSRMAYVIHTKLAKKKNPQVSIETLVASLLE